MNREIKTVTNARTSEQTKRGAFAGRRYLIAILAMLAMMVAIPSAAWAADGVSDVNTNNTTINGKTMDFGTFGQNALPKTKTFYLWTNTYSNGTFCSVGISCTNKTITGNIALSNTAYRRNGGTCGGTNPMESTIVATFTWSGGASFRSCTVILELKAGSAVGTQSGTMTISGVAASTGTITSRVTELDGNNVRLRGPGGEASSFDFGEVAVGDFSDRTFTVSNPGSTGLNLSLIHI